MCIFLLVLGSLGALYVLSTLTMSRRHASTTFVSYIPVLHENGDLIEHPEMLTEEHRQLMQRAYPNIMRLEGGTLLILKKYADDKDLLANLIQKAGDLIEARRTAEEK